MEVTVKIFRYNPEKDRRGHYETYTVEAQETDRILDVLELIKGHQDGSLSFRRSCAHGVCGSDAMRINGKNMLACKALVRDVGTKITVEPLLGLKVEKDLIVDMEPFFDNYRKVLPYFINDSPLPEGEAQLPALGFLAVAGARRRMVRLLAPDLTLRAAAFDLVLQALCGSIPIMWRRFALILRCCSLKTMCI